MKILAVVVGAVVALVLAAPRLSRMLNAGVVRELREKPNGERAQKVMLITLPSGKSIPVNYLREGSRVYAGVDFPWWRELRGRGAEVGLWIRGETLRGHGRAVKDDPALRASVFERLRPSAPRWTGTLVAIAIENEGDSNG